MKFKHKRLNNAINTAIQKLTKFIGLLKSWLVTGVFMITPTAVTLYIIYFIFQFSDGILGNIISDYVGYNMPGIGIIIPILACLLVGAIAQHYVGKRIMTVLDKYMTKIPIIKSLYSSIKQVAEMLQTQNKDKFKRVVLLEYPKDDCWVFGFVTADFNYPINDDRLAKNLVSVFMPTTPNPTSGYLLILSKDKIIDIDIDIEVAMKIIMTGGLVQAIQSDEKETALAAQNAIKQIENKTLNSDNNQKETSI